MARNAIESDFRSSKMAAGSHFFFKSTKKVAYWSETARNAIESDFQSSKMAAGSHFVKKKRVLIWNGEKCDWSSKMAADSHFVRTKIKVAYCSEMARSAIEIHFRSSKIGGGGASQWPACQPFGDIHSICPWANTPILVFKCNNNLTKSNIRSTFKHFSKLQIQDDISWHYFTQFISKVDQK